MEETLTKTSYTIINALEGYKIRLEGELPTDQRSCLERIAQDTLKTAIEYGMPVDCYTRWFTRYSERSNRDQLPLPLSPPANGEEYEEEMSEEDRKELEDELDGWLG